MTDKLDSILVDLIYLVKGYDHDQDMHEEDRSAIDWAHREIETLNNLRVIEELEYLYNQDATEQVRTPGMLIRERISTLQALLRQAGGVGRDDDVSGL